MNRCAIPLGIIMIAAAATPSGDARVTEVFPNFDAREVVDGANRTWINYVDWWNKTRRAPLGGDVELAPQLWAPAITRLAPAYVYTHGVNIVIVRSNPDGNEEGFYVSLAIASSPGANIEQFTRMVICWQPGGTVFTFQRRGHFERATVEKAAPPDPNREGTARSRIAARAVAESVPSVHSFGLFMPREDVLSFTRDVEERIRVYLLARPGDIPLAKYPLISDRDIESYDWKTHTLTVSRSAIQRLRPPLVWGTPFVVVADGEPIYVGAFYSALSSASCSIPVIMHERSLNPDPSGRLMIQRAYPGATGDQMAHDPRSDARIKKALQALGKLKE